MIIHNPHLLTRLDIWFPKYSTKHTTDEYVVLLARYKVDNASPVILIDFTKARHLRGQRFCITRKEAQTYPLVQNGKIDCYEVPMSALKTWDTAAEVRGIAEGLFA